MSRRKKTIRRLRTAAFVAGVSTLFIASLVANRRAAPLVRIGDIKPRMNLSTVHVRGILEADISRLQGGSMLIRVADETGSLPVFLDCAPPDTLPKAGCGIDATGQLRVDAGNRVSMRIHDPRQIRILENVLPTIVHGQVSEVSEPPPDSRAPYRIVLDRPEGPLDIVHWFPPEIEVVAGDRLEAEGVLGFYKGRKQLKVGSPANIRLQPEG